MSTRLGVFSFPIKTNPPQFSDPDASSLDQDAYGDLFYADFIDLLMAPSPTPSSPNQASSRERARNPRTERATSAGPDAFGTRTRQKASAKYGAYSDDENDTSYGISDDSMDGWRARTYPPAAASNSPNHRRIRRPLARRAQSVGRGTSFGRGRSPTSAGVYSDVDNGTDDGFTRRGYERRVSPNVDTRRRASVGGRSTGKHSQRQPGDWCSRPRSPGKLAGDKGVSMSRLGREGSRSVVRGATRQGKTG